MASTMLRQSLIWILTHEKSKEWEFLCTQNDSPNTNHLNQCFDEVCACAQLKRQSVVTFIEECHQRSKRIKKMTVTPSDITKPA